MIATSSEVPHEQLDKKQPGKLLLLPALKRTLFHSRIKTHAQPSVCVSVSVQKQCGQFCVFVCICVFLCGLRVLDCGSVAALSYRRKPVGEGRSRRVCVCVCVRGGSVALM